MAQQIRYGIGFDVKKDGLQQIKKSLKQLQNLTSKDLLNLNKSLDAKDASQTLMDIKRQAVAVEDALRSAFNTKLNTVNIESFNQSLKGSETTIQKVYDTFSQAGVVGQNAFRDLSTQVFNTNIQLKESHTVLDKIGTTLANTVKWNIASSAVNSLTRSVQQAWGFVKSLDTSLNDIRIVTGKSSEEMGKFAEQANTAAESLGRTTTDYTKAALIYAQQGLSDEQIAKRSEVTLKAANVTGQSTDAVSEELTAVWNGYKVNAEQAELYVDRLAAVAATTASDLEELSTGMSKVASAANELGVGEDQLAAQLSTIVSATRQAPETVGTALKTVYARISDIKAGIDQDGVTLGKYSGDMAALGINVLDAQGKLRDMGSIIEEVGSKWQGMTREQQISLAQTMAGQRQYSNLMALFGNFDKYTSALNTARNAAGTLQQQQNIYMESTAAHLEKLTAAIEKIYMSIADTDAINDLIDGLTTVAKLTGSFVDSIGGGGAILRDLGAIGISVFSNQIAKSIGTTITNFEIGQENARQFKEILEEINTWKSPENMDQASRDLLNNQQRLAELAKSMTPEQFSGMQTLLKDINQLGNEIKLIQEKVKPAQEALKALGKTTPLTDILGKGEEIDKISKSINEPIDELDKLQQKAEQTKKSFSKDFNFANEVSKTADPVERFSQAFEKAKEKSFSLIDALEQIQSSEAFENLNDDIKGKLLESTETLKGQWQDLSTKINQGIAPNNREKVANEFKGFFKGLVQAIENSSQEIKDKYKDLIQVLGNPDDINKLEQKKAQLKKKLSEFNSGITRAERTQQIENYAKLAGGIAQVGSAIRQVQNLGSIFMNKDLSAGEKLFQIVTNLAISLPMLAKGFGAIGKSMGLMIRLTQQQVTIGKIWEGQQAKQLFAFKKIENGADSAGYHMKLFGSTFSVQPIMLWITGITAAIGILSMLNSALEQARKERIENLKSDIEEQKQKQEQISGNQQLYKSLGELNQQYKNGEISRTDLQNSVKDLINQYELQGQAADKLAASYSNLSKYLKEARDKSADEMAESASETLNLAKKRVKEELEDEQDFLGQNLPSYSFKATTLGYQANKQILDTFQSEIEDQNFKDIDFINNKGEAGFKIKINFDSQSFKTLYDFLKNKRDEIKNLVEDGVLEKEDLENDDFYNKIEDWLSDHQQLYSTIVDAEKQDLAAAAEKVGNEHYQSLENIQTGNDYLRKRQKIIQEISKKLGVSTKEATELANDYFNKEFQDKFIQYNPIAEFFDKLKKQFKDKDGSLIQQLIGDLDPDQLSWLNDKIAIDPSIMKDWEKLKAFVEYVLGMNPQKVQDSLGNSLESQMNAASQNYDKYQPLQEKVNKDKKISKKQYEEAVEGTDLQQYFTGPAIDGTRRLKQGTDGLTKSLYNFNQAIQRLEIGGFKNILNNVQEQQKKLKEFTDSNFSYDNLRQKLGDSFKNADPNAINSLPGLNSPVESSLNYLENTTKAGTELRNMVDNWKVLFQQGGLINGQVQKIYGLLSSVGDQTDKLKGQSEELGQQAKFIKEQIEEVLDPLDEDVSIKQYKKLSDEIFDNPEKFGEFVEGFKDLDYAKEVTDDMSEGMLRFDNAIEDANENFSKWQKSAGNLGKYTDELKDTYQDMLDIDGEVLSDDFAQDAQNLELMEQALNGNLDAYNQLVDAASQDVWQNIVGVDPNSEAFESIKTQYDLMKKQLEENPVKIGDTIDFNTDKTHQAMTGYFQEVGQAAYNQAYAATGDVGQAMQESMDAQIAAMDAFGYEPVFSNQVVQNNDTESLTEWETEVTPNPVEVSLPGGAPVPIPGTNSSLMQPTPAKTEVGNVDSITEKPTDVPATSKKATSGTGVSFQITGARNKGGGGPKINNSKKTFNNGGGGGSKGKGKKGGGGKKGGKKGGKGSSKKNEPDKSQKDLQKKLKDERDIYHDINIQIGKINKSLNRTQKKQDRLYGKQLLQNLNKQTKILEQHKKKLEEKNKLQQQDLKNQQVALSNLGVTFNKYGDIANYMDSLGKKQNEINSLIDKQNALIKKYNKETNKDKKKKIGDSIEKVDKTKSTKEEEYKDLQDRIKDYDKLREQMEDIKDQIEEQTQKQIEIQITKFRMKVEIRLEMGQAQRDWNKFRRDVLQHTNILKDSNFSSILKDAQLNQTDAQSYFKVGNGPGSFETLTKQLLQTREQIESINQTGTSTIYGDNKKQAMQDLKSDLDELMSQMEDYESLIDEIDQAYLDTIDDVEEFFDKQIEDYEYVNDLINHDMDLLTLLYGEKSYNAMDKYYTKLQSNNLKQIDSLKKQRDFWGQQWKEAAAAGDTKAAEKFKENYKKVIADLNSVVEDAAQTIQDKYINAIDNIFDRLDKKMTNGKGTDYLNMEWDLMQKNADEYLDTINSAFAIQQTERKYQKAINDTKNIKNQKELKKVMNEQLSILKNKQKLTQYDIDRAQKLLQVEQARIALEDARSAKTSMQLKRDSQGNYSYEYVADNDAIADAESEYANTVNDLYNFDLDRYKSNLQDMLSAWEEFQEKYKEIQLDVSLTDEERIQRLKLLEEEYGEYINGKTAENLVVRKNLKESAFQDMQQLYADDVAEFQNMSDSEKNILMNQLVPEWESGIQRMTDKFSAQGGFIPSCEEAFKNIHTATVDYEKELDELAKTADTDFSSLRNGIDDTADSFSNLIDKNNELIDQMQTELNEIKDLKTAAHELSLEYKNVYDQAKQATKAIYDFMQAERERAAEEAKREAAANGQGAAGGGTQARFTGDSFAGILKAQGDQKLSKLIKSGKIVARQTVDQQISAGGLGGSSHNLIQGLAGNILLTNEWGNGEDRKQKMIEKFGDQLGKELYNRTGLYLQDIASNEEKKKNFIAWVLREPDWFRIFDYAQFQSNQAMYTQNVNSFVRQGNKGYVYDTGGYTGNWNSKEGRPAILHEKQLVLNQEDTKNILSSVSIMRSIMTSLTGSLTSRLDNLKTNSLPFSFEQKGDTIEQQVSIQASFPNVNSKREIQEALNDLVNLAAQRAMR